MYREGEEYKRVVYREREEMLKNNRKNVGLRMRIEQMELIMRERGEEGVKGWEVTEGMRRLEEISGQKVKVSEKGKEVGRRGITSVEKVEMKVTVSKRKRGRVLNTVVNMLLGESTRRNGYVKREEKEKEVEIRMGEIKIGKSESKGEVRVKIRVKGEYKKGMLRRYIEGIGIRG